MRKEIISRFPAGQISRYIEVFGGAGWVLFGKPQQPGQLEVYNDIDGDLVNLYRCVKSVSSTHLTLPTKLEV